MRKPKIGDIVHYYHCDFKEPFPAIVFTLYSDCEAIDLVVFMPDNTYKTYVLPKDNVENINHWSWPEEEKFECKYPHAICTSLDCLICHPGSCSHSRVSYKCDNPSDINCPVTSTCADCGFVEYMTNENIKKNDGIKLKNIAEDEFIEDEIFDDHLKCKALIEEIFNKAKTAITSEQVTRQSYDALREIFFLIKEKKGNK